MYVALLFGPTLFLSAFLLFCCEPMIGKMMLPLLGGAASVWITCLLFFQLMLLAGYVYAHLLERFATVRTQIVVHSAMMLAALAFLPMQFAARPDEAAVRDPIIWLLTQLIATVGIPFGVVSTTAPLLQNWLSKTSSAAARDPYFLYAISNAGSLIALLSYPVLIEPRMGVRMQSSVWLGGYAALAAMVVIAAAIVWKSHIPTASVPRDQATRPEWKTRAYWMAAAFVPSALMLAVTNHILLNLASVPFLWIIPLAVYLVTFMIAFARKIHVSVTLMSRIAPVVLLLMFPIVAVPRSATRWSWLLMGGHIVLLLASALLCHSALASRRPDPQHLTEYYFWIALGGALGGIFTAVIAPVLFKTVLEYPLLVAVIAFFRIVPNKEEKLDLRDGIYLAGLAAAVAFIWVLFRWAKIDITESVKTSGAANVGFALIAYSFRERRWRFALALVILIGGYSIALPPMLDDDSAPLYVARNFFGIKKVVFDTDSNMRKLLHGDTMHGLESLDPTLAGHPLSYYHETGPVGDVMKMLSDRPNQHIGVLGLGTGSMAGYTAPNRRITFFDIDPQVYGIAHNYFTFLNRCDKNCDILIGDGRLSIEKMPEGEFDLLMLDAFNSDSIPAHLVSREAVQTYLSKLKPNGLILFHVSNRYMNVEGLVSAVVTDAPLEALVRYDDDEEPTGKSTSDYVVAARHMEDLGMLAEDGNWTRVTKPDGVEPWTDDYSNMLTILRW
jgi:SAM-dependent methyltransferase